MYVIIVGCGRVGSSLAKLLAEEEHNVVVIDKNAEAFNRLGKRFNGTTIQGCGFDVKVLREAGIEEADAFCAVTNGDNTNIMASEVAKKIFKVPKVIARIYDPRRAEIYKSLGLNVISGTVLFAAMIRDKLIEEKFSSFLLETSEFGVLEIEANEVIVGKTIAQLNMPSQFIVVSLIRRNYKPIIPESTETIQNGDKVVGIASIAALSKIKKHLGVK